MALQPVQNDDEIEPAFRCFCCGVCCSKYQVQMTIGEAHRIAEKLRIEWDTFESGYLDNAWPGVKTVLLRHSGGHCVFLEPQPGDRTFFCRIQKFKRLHASNGMPTPIKKTAAMGWQRAGT